MTMERYEAYKDSGVEWIGEIPEGWEVAPLKTQFSFGKGLPITKADLIEEGEPVISYGQIHSKANTPAHIKQELVRYVSPSFLDSNAASITHKGDFLFADTSEDVDGSGNFVFHDLDERVFAGYHTLILRPIDASCGRYLSYLFQDDRWKAQLRSRVSGVKLFSLTLRILTKASLLLPSMAEQQAIADYLDAKTAEIDALVADCEREVELLQEYRKAVISEVVTKGLNPDAPMKDSGIEWIGEIPETWSMAKVKSCCDILSGYAFKSELFIQESDSVKLLRGINLGVNVVRWDEVVSYPLEEIEELATYRLLAGDVVIGLDRPWIKEGLRIAIIQDEIFEQYLVQRVARLRGSSELDVRFVKYALESGLLGYELDSLTTGVSVPHISTEQIGSTRIALPDITTQQKIVALLDIKTAEIDSLINAKQHMADKLREYRKSLISEAVTGKFKVPGVE